ncbi:(S)-ureidoglycine aminohydrolase [uncultured Mitsuokella sp.]|uniref:(S)-ureidoglycine aminohydrolase n=1 Tax=uncultured Mitsuokella sp. TaxID=453120 RepID=UPI0025DE2B78|nr:(S)-ureidoglycine aminohydrolase [uncultured Mitsuokella sp.]
MSYPEHPLSTRAIVKPGLWAVLPEGGLVNNVIPAIKGCRVSIVASPKMGASFVQYIITAQKDGHTAFPLASEEGVESFIYVVSGSAKVKAGEHAYDLTAGGYMFAPAEYGVDFTAEDGTKLLFYKQKYIPLAGTKAHIVTGNVNEMKYAVYEGMDNVGIKDLLPTDDLGFDMNMHILSFEPGGCHSFVETHVQEHGAYVLTGEGMYIMEQQWLPIQKGDFMWFGPFVPQGAYGIGREPFAYIYSKDCNRDVLL